MNRPISRQAILAVLIMASLGRLALGEALPAANAPLLIDRDRLDRQARPREGQANTPTAPAPDAAVPAEATIKPFVLKAVQVRGADSLSQHTVEDSYRDKIGTTVTIADIAAITNNIGDLYKAAGYPLYSVVVPKQNFDGGVLIVSVTEGYIDNIVIDGDTDDADLDLIRAYAAKIVADRPLRHTILARYLLLMNDIPGLKVGSRFDPAPSSAGVALHLTIERKHFDFGTAFNNEGSKFISRQQFTATATANATFQEGDRTELIYGLPINFRDYHYYGLTHMEPLGTEGTTVQFSTSYLQTRPVHSTVSGDAYTASFQFAVPIVRQQEENISLIGSLDALDSASAFLGQTFSNERTRVVRAGVFYNAGPLDGTHVISANAVLSQGVDWLGARAGGYVPGGPTFTKVNVRFGYDRTLGPKFIARFKAAGQYAPDSVPPSEEFTYGGGDFGRAFGDAEVVGDSGIAASAELAYRLPTDWIGVSWLAGAEGYGFYDVGKLWLKSPLLQSPGLGQSAGIGARVRVYDKVTLQMEAGFPIECPSPTNNCSAGRGIFNLTSKF